MDEQKVQSTLNISLLIHNFVTLFKRVVIFAVIISLLVGGMMYYRADRSYTPIYTSTVIFSVRANFTSPTDIESSNSFLDTSAALMLSNTFWYVMNSEHARMLMSAELGLNYFTASLSATATADSALFTMRSTGYDPQEVYNVLMAAVKIYPIAASTVLGDTRLDILNEPAGPSTEPSNSNTAFYTGRNYTIITFALCVILIFLLSLTRRTVHSAEDLRRLVNLKCLAYVPALKLKKHSDRAHNTISITNPKIDPAFNESIRALRVKLKRLLEKHKSCVLLITSTVPNEGKTTVAANLALSLASEGKRVILIDGDLRKQSLKPSLGLDIESEGLVDILNGKSKNLRLINVPDSSLLLLAGDTTIDQPQSLLDSPRMRQIIQLLREKLDYIIIDSPPAGIMSDAATISKYSDALLYVVRQDMASSAEILNAIQSISAAGGNLIGCVLNRTQAGTTRYGYGSKYNAGYSYSYGNKYSTYGYRRRYSRYAPTEEVTEDSKQ